MSWSQTPLTPQRANPANPSAVVALGSNLGHSQATVEAAVAALSQDPLTMVVACSRWYETAAIGPPQPNYINGCVRLRTQRSPHSLLHFLLDLEQQFGRVRQERWGPRTLDLDLLVYGTIFLKTRDLILPHPRMTERVFVLVPLQDIWPNWIDPVSQQSLDQLLQQVDWTGISCLL